MLVCELQECLKIKGSLYILGIFGLSRSERLGRITFSQNIFATLTLLQPYIIFKFLLIATQCVI